MFRYLAEISRSRPKVTAGYIFVQGPGDGPFFAPGATLDPGSKEGADYKTFLGTAALHKTC